MSDWNDDSDKAGEERRAKFVKAIVAALLYASKVKPKKKP